MNVVAPGKIILSGEHAVLYGHPILATAINRYTRVQISTQDSAFITVCLNELDFKRDISFSTLSRLKQCIKQDYQQFLQGQLSVREVLKEENELILFAISLLFDHSSHSSEGIKLNLSSTIPVGCGMGSSAAAIVAVLYALTHHLGLEIEPDVFFQLALEAENVQHGRSSGIDLQMSKNGGCFYKKNNNFVASRLPSFPLYLVNTGAPHTSTGECHMIVADHFKKSLIGDEFAAVTAALNSILLQPLPNKKDFVITIRENHRLLVKIGVVPKKVQQFINEIEKMGGAAKICGAGAVAGEAAGAVIATVENEETLYALSKKYQYLTSVIQGESRGVHVL